MDSEGIQPVGAPVSSIPAPPRIPPPALQDGYRRSVPPCEPETGVSASFWELLSSRLDASDRVEGSSSHLLLPPDLRTSALPSSVMFLARAALLTFSCWLAPHFFCYLPQVCAQKPGSSRWLIGDRDGHCGVVCSRTQGKPVCGSDGRSYETGCELQRARCKDKTLTLAHRGRCRGRNKPKAELLPAPPAATSTPEAAGQELKDVGLSKCRADRRQALEQTRKPQDFIPECNEDGSFAQVQCHTLTGYCWCATSEGKPVGGSTVRNRTPVCSGNTGENMGTHAGTSGLSGSVTDKPPGPANSGRKVSFRFFLTLNPDDGSKPTPTMETHTPPEGDEITPSTLWEKHFNEKYFRPNNSTSRKQDKVPSCDQERQSALSDARHISEQDAFIPDCGSGGLYRPVQCHQSTGYCWCVLEETGRPIAGSATRYRMPDCDGARVTEDPFAATDLPGCPEGKKAEFITSLLDALTTDMVQAMNSPAPSGGGRFVEPDPSHTLEERVVQWYFDQLDNNGSQDVNKKELKPFKRYLKKKAKPKRCARKFTDYCDRNKDRAISLQELKGCLGVGKEGSSTTVGNKGTRQGTNVFLGRLV
ncbi:SPARC-related modular calcium-binding protein 1 isoform X1 [Oryzias latipes]|uniref:SPARC-related modular calcium-binding protein 1 isoform X1 n=1 Tax=Oryzias latipes TaxID=8090 RepID=UPI0009D9A553|nr:SPARC-related modular calcium-binding protein 1 isoform X1 [Oryzias latipes]